MPILAEGTTSWPDRFSGCCRVLRIRLATAMASWLERMPSSSTVNSSPPRRAALSALRTLARRRSANAIILRRRFYLPWFLLSFVVVGVLFSYVPIPDVASQRVLDIYNLCFTAALASVGLNADVRKVGPQLLKPLALILVVFLADLGLFLATAQFLAY
jgi:hypothetical protein